MSDSHSVMNAAGDIVSLGVVVGTLAHYLPAVAALFTIVWTAIRICETDTVRSILRRPSKPER